MRYTALLLTAICLPACHTATSSAPGMQDELAAMPQRAGLVTLRDKGVTLLGRGVEVDQPAPDFVAVDPAMQEKRLSDYQGKVVLLSVVPSLDTNVCSTQTRRFNEEAASIGDDIVILTISMDLPMAQKRWCGAHGVDRVVTLSDYRYWSFAQAFGLRIKESGLLARSLFVIDRDGVIRYQQIVPELTTEPDYAPALDAAKSLASAGAG